jgi:hypothetical protein
MHTYMIEMIERARNDRRLFDLRTRNDQTARIAARKALDDSMTIALDDEAREKVLDLIAAGEPGEDRSKDVTTREGRTGTMPGAYLRSIPPCHSRGGFASDLEQRRPGDLRFPIGPTALFAALGAAYPGTSIGEGG